MKILLPIILIVVLGCVSAQAQRRGGGRGVNQGERGAAREFQNVRGEFDAWRLATLEADLFKMPAGDAGGGEQNFYAFLHSAVKEERLSDENFGKLGQDYIKLVLIAQKEGKAKVETDLVKLRERVKELADGQLNPAIATLDLNQKQVQAQEYLWFGILSNKISSGKRSTLERKQKALMDIEKKAKADEKMEEREREKLNESASKLVQELMEELSR